MKSRIVKYCAIVLILVSAGLAWWKLSQPEPCTDMPWGQKTFRCVGPDGVAGCCWIEAVNQGPVERLQSTYVERFGSAESEEVAR